MEKKRPQLSLDELYQLKWMLGGILVLLSACTVFYLDLDGWTLMALTTVGTIAVLARPTLPARVPALAHRLAFPVIVAVFVGDLVLLREILPAIVRLDLMLLFYRAVSYRKKRDDLQVIVLGLFLIVVAGVLTVSLLFAAQLLVFTACALVFLLVVTLVELMERNGVTAGAPGVPRWTEVAWSRLWWRVREVADWRVVALGAGLFVGVVGVSVVLFLAIPRFQLENSLFLERFVSRKARSGFTESVTFGQVTEIQSDNSLAISVDVTDRAQMPAMPYWRMLVLDEYTKGSFRMSPLLRQTLGREFTSMNVIGSVRPHRGEPTYWTFYVESGVSRYLPLLGPFQILRFRELQNFRSSQHLALVALRDEPASMTAYRVESMLNADTLPDSRFAQLLAEGGRPRGIAAKMLNPGLGADDVATLRVTVREITGGATLAAPEFARRATDWLRARHAYSLQPRIPSGAGDVLVRWLESREGGHCELFAGSLVALARVAGFPARMVTGFRGGTWNGYSNSLAIRNSEAHAWCEIFDEASGAWHRADPTPGGAGAQGDEAKGDAALARRTDRSWSARLESLRVFWYRRIVNFDQQSQVETLQAVKSATENTGKRLREWFSGLGERIAAWLTGPWTFGRAANGLGILAVLVAAAIGARRLARTWSLRRARSGARLDPIRVQAGHWLQELDERASTGDWAGLRRDLQRLRFGARETWPASDKVFRRARQAYKTSRSRR